MPLRTETYILLAMLLVRCISIVYTYEFEVIEDRDERRYYPFMVLLDIQGGDVSVCGGTLIDQWRILTAAHCINKASWVIAILGTQTLDEIYDFFPLNKSRFLIHDFNETTHENDIALIYLDQYIPLDDKINVVSLPSEENISNDKDTKPVVLGWELDGENFNDHILTKNVTILDINECNDEAKSSLDHTIMCARGKDIFEPGIGDSGEPVLSENIQIGILSGGTKKYTGLVLFTRIEKYLPWIKNHVLLPGESSHRHRHRRRRNG